MSNIRKYVKGGSMIFTDEWMGYNSLEKSEYSHLTIHHKENKFVKGNVYTNTIEGFWGQLRRMIIGIYHSVSSKYLQRYVDEAAFRYNTASYKEGKRFDMIMDNAIGKRSYEYIKQIIT